jgi:hypothetical protein
MRTAFLMTSLALTSAASAAPPRPADAEIAVTAERLSRGALRAQASKYVRATMADARNGQNARWFDPICAAAIGVESQLGSLFTTRLEQVASHVGLKMAKPGCDANLVIAFTSDAPALVKAINRRQHGALDALPGAERALLKSPTLPVRWWHFTMPTSADGKPFSPGPLGLGASANGMPSEITYNNNARASRIDLTSRVGITGAVVVVDINRLGKVSMPALTDYVALVALSRIRMDPRERPTGSILAMFEPGAPQYEGLTDLDERFISAMYESRATVENWQQRAEMAGRMADAAVQPTGSDEARRQP